MDADTVDLAAAIGDRVRRERRGRGLTLDGLAATAGVSRRALVNVEQGTANPSVGTLLRIGDALGVGLPTLVAPPVARPVRVTKAGTGATLWTGDSGGRGVLVAASEAPDVLELWHWRLAPGEARTSEAHPPGTRELLQVHSGEVVLDVAGHPHRLGPGDAASFPADVGHGYACGGSDEATFSLVVLEPGPLPARAGAGA